MKTRPFLLVFEGDGAGVCSFRFEGACAMDIAVPTREPATIPKPTFAPVTRNRRRSIDELETEEALMNFIAGLPRVIRMDYKILIVLAGIPPTTVRAGTSLVTTAPAATTASSPMVTPCVMVALAPIHAFLLIWICPTVNECRFSGESGCPSLSRLTLGAMKTPSSMVIPPKSRKTQSKLMKTFRPILRVLPVVHVERGKDRGAIVDFRVRDS